MGTELNVCDGLAASPLINDVTLSELYGEAVKGYDENARFASTGKTGTGCTDMGDVSMIMPAIHPNACGASGMSHGNDYTISDPNKACIGSATVQVILLDKLLSDNAQNAQLVLKNKGEIVKC